jgi:carboxynorspermidine decarboxylase
MDIPFDTLPSPCYIIDKSRLLHNLSVIDTVRRESGVSILMALKGFASWQAFSLIKPHCDGGAVSSENETLLAHQYLSKHLHAYAPAYLPEEFETIATLSSHLTFNSISQYEQWHQKAKQYNSQISLGLRVNPEYSDVETALYNPANPLSRLGITEKYFPQKLPPDIEGLHIHTLCESTATAFEKLLENTEKKFGQFFQSLKWINFGGGHLMTHRDYDTPLLIRLLNDFRLRYPHLEVILEPSAAFVWQVGFLVSKVLDIVENETIKTAILNVSFTAHMPDTLEMPYQPKVLGADNGDTKKYSYRLGGNSCLAGDFIGNWSFDTPLSIGDTIVFDDMIHYTTVKTTFFNGVKHPYIGLWDNDLEKLIKYKEFSFDDFKNRLG